MQGSPTVGAASPATSTDSLAARLRVLQTVALAMTVSVVLYVVVAWLVIDLRAAGPRPASLAQDSEVLAAGLAGILILVSSRLRSRLAATPRRERLTVAAAAPGGPAAGAPGAGGAELEPRFRRYRRAVLVSLAMREAVGIIGLVYALLVGDARWAIVFGLAAVLSLLAAWPRRREFLRLTR